MIITNLQDAKRYKSLSQAMSKAIDYVESGEWKNLPQDKKKYVVHEGEVAAMRMLFEPKEDAKWEAHRDWTDIQMIVSGQEKMLFAPIYDLDEKGEYLSEKDFQEYEGEKKQEIIANAGDLIIFFPEDGYKPGLIASSSEVDKVVIKVLA